MVREQLTQLASMGSAATRIDPSVHEGTPLDQLQPEIVRPLLELIEQAARVIEPSDAAAPDALAALLAFDRALDDPSAALREAGPPMLRSLASPRLLDAWDAIEWAERSTRAIAKLAWAARRLLDGAAQAAPTEERASLAARRAAATFRAAVLRDVAAPRRLAHLTSAISVLVGRPGYRALPTVSRRDLRSVQSRLRGGPDEPTLAALVGEASQLSRRFLLVSHRPELESHDLTLLESVTPRVLEAAHHEQLIDDDDWQLLTTLRGLNDVFDELLDHGDRFAASLAPLLVVLLKRQRAPRPSFL